MNTSIEFVLLKSLQPTSLLFVGEASLSYVSFRFSRLGKAFGLKLQTLDLDGEAFGGIGQ